MSTTKYDVVAIGNAIVDIIGRCEDEFLLAHGCSKGHMNLVDAATISALYDDMGPSTEISGGSAANTAVGVASFGGRAGFIGKTADDEFGHIFAHDIKAAGVAFANKPEKSGAPTSRSLILVTPDGERTMNTLLGISTELGDAEIDPVMIQSTKVLYLEGYLFDRPEAKDAFRKSVSLAKRAGREVALSLSDGFCVDRHRDDFLSLVKTGVDIVFANEDEIRSLYQTSDFDAAAEHAAKEMKLAALTRSGQGSLIVSGDKKIAVPVDHVPNVIDTTGAGDLYAAGFLYGYTRGHDLAAAARLGSIAAAEIISHTGARPAVSLSSLAKSKGISLR